MPIAYRGKDERVERILMYYCTSSLLALVQDAAEEPSTYCFADTLETKRDALSARRGSCQKSENPIPTPCAVFRDRNPLLEDVREKHPLTTRFYARALGGAVCFCRFLHQAHSPALRCTHLNSRHVGHSAERPPN